MPGLNINQLPTAATSILATDKLYLGRSPFGVTDDRYILGSVVISQLAPLTTKGDIYTFTTVNARLPVATGNGKILQVNSVTATGLDYSTATYPVTAGTQYNSIASDGTNFTSQTLTALLDGSFGNVQGDILYRNATNWVVLAPGTSGEFLKTQGAAANPVWATAAGTGIQLISNSVTTTAGPTVTFRANGTGGTGFFTISGATLNLIFNDASDNIMIGRGTPVGLAGTGGDSCTGVGTQVFQSAVTTSLSTGFGYGVLVADTNGISNSGFGALSLTSLNGGINCDGLGYLSGSNYTGLESNNMCLGSNVAGVLGESNTIRVGDGSRTRFFAGGIDGVNVGSSTVRLVSESATQLGTIDLVGGTGITITPSANTITVSVVQGGLVWSTITINQTADPNNGYVANKGTLLSITLPALCAVGDIVEINGLNTGLWSVIGNTGQTIIYNNVSSSTAGSLTSTQQYDTVMLKCLVVNTAWTVVSTISTNLVLA